MNDSDDKKLEDALMAQASELATDIQPQRDLWPNIAAAIAEPQRVSPWNRYIAQAAAVLLLIGGSSGLTYLAVTDDSGMAPTVIQNPDLIFQPVSGRFGSQYTLGPDFQDAHNVVASRLETELQRLSPEERAGVHKSLSSIRAAISDINQALAKQPDNTLLQKLLLSSYQEELSVMRKVNGITSAVMFREDF